MNTPLTRSELQQAAELGMTLDQYRSTKQAVEAKYGIAPPTPAIAATRLDPLTAHEKSEARELGLTESDYLESKLLVAKKYGAGANHND